jgi:galactokinase
MSTASDTSALKAQFAQTFGSGGRMHVVRSPGRVNLIGEHTDYNDGFVFPMAIEPHVLIACRGREDQKVRLASAAYPGQVVEFSVAGKITRGEPAWANYCRGVAAELLGAGIPLVGMDAFYTNTLPLGGGLSSSAAMIVGTGLALLTLAGASMDPQRLALLAQKAEHDYAGVPVGIMDQTIIAVAKKGTAVLLDCRDLSKQFIPLDANELKVVIVNSMVKHELTGGEYAQRRKQCEQGVAFFRRANPEIKALRDVTMKQLDSAKGKLDDVVFRRCRHVIAENARTTDYATQLTRKNYEQAGELMLKSHQSLRNDYEVSTAELDYLVSESMKIKGVYGARMTGGGFGGSIVALVQPRGVDGYTQTISASYQKKFNITPEIFVTDPSDGARGLE